MSALATTELQPPAFMTILVALTEWLQLKQAPPLKCTDFSNFHWTDKQTNRRQAGRQADRQADRQTNRQTQTDRQADRHWMKSCLP